MNHTQIHSNNLSHKQCLLNIYVYRYIASYERRMRVINIVLKPNLRKIL